MYTSGVYWSISKSPLMAKLRPGRVKIYYVKHFIFDEVVWLSRLVLQKKYINPLLPNGSPFEDLGPHHCVTRPKFWPIPRLFIRDKFCRYRYRDFFSETKFSDTGAGAGDAVQVVMHCRLWCTEGYDALQVVMHWSNWCTEAGDALEAVMHWSRWCIAGGDALPPYSSVFIISSLVALSLLSYVFFYFKVWELLIVFPAPIFDCCTPVADYLVLGK